MGFTKATKILSEYSNYNGKSILEAIAVKLVSNLEAATPVDSGTTAASWSYSVDKVDSGYELNIYNSAYAGGSIPLPLLIYYGHGTGTGGYVAPNDFISPSFELAKEELSKLIEKEFK